MHAILADCRNALQIAQDQQATTANEERRPTTVKEGDSVFISTKNLPPTYTNVSDASDSTKLRHLYAGPFRIEKMIGPNAARLEIPKGMDIEKSQNVSIFKEDNTKGNRGEAPEVPLRRVRGRNEGIYEVEKVVDHAQSGTNGKKVKYRVRYVNYDETEDEWKSLKELDGARELVEDYHIQQGLDPPNWPQPKEPKRRSQRKKRHKEG